MLYLIITIKTLKLARLNFSIIRKPFSDHFEFKNECSDKCGGTNTVNVSFKQSNIYIYIYIYIYI